jgi:DNA-binding MarR family transcriptional regulator
MPKEPLPGLGPLLFRTARLLNEHAVSVIEAEARVGLRPSHTTLLPHLDLEEGTRLTELAEAMGITKQAVGQLVEDLERMGVVHREPDPLDGRAKRVKVTRQGRAAFQHGQQTLRALEAEVARKLGRAEVDALRRGLADLMEVLEEWEDRRERSG